MARIASLSSNARAGLMMMENANGDARFVSIVKDLTRRVRTEYRASTGGNIYSRPKNHSSVKWLRMVREGSKFKTYTSRDGNSWRLVHILTFSSFEECIYTGLIVYNTTNYTPATAVFKQVKVMGDDYSSLTASPDAVPAVFPEPMSNVRTQDGSRRCFPGLRGFRSIQWRHR